MGHVGKESFIEVYSKDVKILRSARYEKKKFTRI